MLKKKKIRIRQGNDIKSLKKKRYPVLKLKTDI